MRNKENIVRLNRERYLRIKDEKWYLEQKHNWYLSQREKISTRNKEKRAEYRKLNPIIRKTKEEIQAKRDVWMAANRGKLNVDALKRRSENLEKYQQYARGYYRDSLSFKAQYSRLKLNTKIRNLEVAVSIEEFIEIVSKPCAYCGEKKERRGIDRKDNKIGYTLKNSAPCCKICNYMKKTMTVKEFLNHVKKIAKHNS